MLLKCLLYDFSWGISSIYFFLVVKVWWYYSLIKIRYIQSSWEGLVQADLDVSSL